MTCCFTPRGAVLTRAERDAVARLRERRAAGVVPTAVAHPAVHENTDTMVSFYSTKPASTAHSTATRQRVRRARNNAQRRVRRVRLSGHVAVKRVSANAAHAVKGAAKGAAKPRRNNPHVAADELRALTPQQRAPDAGTSVLNAVKAVSLWHAVRKREQSAREESDWTVDVARIKEGARRRLEGVRSRIVRGGRAKEKVVRELDDSDLNNEANNDRYFQQIMTADA